MKRQREPSDEELILKIREGDEGAFRVCCQRYREHLLARIEKELPGALQGKVSAVDVLQDVYLVAWRRVGELELRGEDALARWLGKVVDYKVKEVVRHYVNVEKRETGREHIPNGSGTGLSKVTGGPTPSQVAVAGELRDAAARAWGELSESYRAVLTLVKEEGLSTAEAGERLGISRDAAKKMYGRAVALFSKLLEKHGGLGS